MGQKPSYEELEQRVQALEKEVVGCKKPEEPPKVSGEGYRDFFNLNPDPVVIVQDKAVKLANSAYTELFGVNQEDLDRGFSLFDHLQEKDKDGVHQKYEERISGKELQEVHYFEIRTKNGKNIPCEGYSSLIQYDGRPALLAVIRDVSKKKEADEMLRVSETRYRSLFEAAGDGIFLLKVFDQDLSFTDFNPRVLEMFRCTRDELLGKAPLDFSPPIQPDGAPSKKKALEMIQPVLEGRSQFFEWKHRRPDGSFFDSETSLTRLSIKGDIYIQAIVRDITERKQIQKELEKHRNHLEELVTERTKELQKINKELRAEISERKRAEDALTESEAKYKSIFENVAVSIILIDADGQMLDINPYHISHIARGKVIKEDLLGQNLFSYPTVIAGGIAEEMKRVLDGKSVNIAEHYFPITSGGMPSHFNSRAVPLFVDGEVTGAVIMFEDITKIKRSEEHIRELSHQLMKTQERERQMISYELHDSVAQELSSSKITCEMVLRDKSLTPGARKQISELSGNLHKTLKSVRDLSYELRPPGLAKLGFPHVMRQFCMDFSEKTGVRVDFQSAGMDNLNISYDTKINLYRLLQEGLNNVKKHADAGNVQIRLVSSFPNVILRIDDDGKGFDLKERLAKASGEKRMGLSSMANRVDLLLGRIKIESVPGKGTKVVIEVPQKDENIRA